MRLDRRSLAAVACLAGLGAMAAALATCSRAKKPRERGELTDVEKSAIAAFTSGTISRESPVRVAFHEALATPDQVGAPLETSPFRFEPRIKGTAVWAAPDRLEFRPAERLPDGAAYAASLDLTALFPEGKAPQPRFDFVFGTMRQSFDVAVEGLQAQDATDVKRQTLTGRLITADVEDAPGVEKCADGRARRSRARAFVGARPRPPHPRLHGQRDRARRGGLDPPPPLGRQPDRRLAQGRPRDLRPRPQHLRRRAGAGRGRPGAARGAALHRSAQAWAEPQGAGADRGPRRPALRDRLAAGSRSTAPAAGAASRRCGSRRACATCSATA